MPYQDGFFRFGVFELDGRTGDLRKSGKSSAKLTGQPLELLLHLLERPGEPVSREELRQRLWPADTVVDYDQSLNTAVNRLREALGDNDENPCFIQFMPWRGYRFIAPVDTGENPPAVTIMPSGEMAAANSILAPDDSPHALNSSRLLSNSPELSAVPNRYSRLLFALLQTMYLSFYVLAMAGLAGLDAALRHLMANSTWLFVGVIITACIGIPVRLFLLAAAVFGYRGLTGTLRRIFPALFLLDEFWSLAPLLLVARIGWGLALAATASLAFLPFSQRSALLMDESEEFSHDLHR